MSSKSKIPIIRTLHVTKVIFPDSDRLTPVENDEKLLQHFLLKESP